MPLLLGFTLVALFIWFAENIGTFTAAWIYPHQRQRLGAGALEQTRRLVPPDDHQLRPGGDAEPTAAAASTVGQCAAAAPRADPAQGQSCALSSPPS